jgi:hypothetical protein
MNCIRIAVMSDEGMRALTQLEIFIRPLKKRISVSQMLQLSHNAFKSKVGMFLIYLSVFAFAFMC